MRTIVTYSLAAAFFAGLLTACSASIESRVVTPATHTIVLRVAGGGPLPYVPGLDCRDHRAVYALNLKTHELAWDFCFTGERGKRVLTSDEAATLGGTLAQLRVVASENLCPVDNTDIVLTTTGGIAREYRNDGCGAKPPLLDNATLGRLLGVLMNFADR